MSDEPIAPRGGSMIHLPDCRVPFIDQYMGLWLMHEPHFWAKYELIRQMNISVHVAQATANRDVVNATPQRKSSGGGYGYIVGGDGITVIELRGSLMKQESSADSSTSTVAIRRDVRAAMNDADVKGVMFVMDSPGGTVAGAYELADDIAALAAVKPTATFVDGLSASAAYLQAAMTGAISAYRTAEVGSIGTRMVVVDSSAMAAMKGLKVYAIDSGGMKSAGQPGTEITAEQLAYFQSIIDDAQQHFTEAVTRGRKMSADKVKTLADGRIHSASKAQALGLIDHVESFDQAMTRLRATVAKAPAARTTRAATTGVGAAHTTTNDSTAKETDRADTVDDASTGPAADSAAATPQEDHSMSDPTKTAAAGNTTAVADGPKPATIAELKAAFPNDPGFALDAAAQALTLVEAKAHYADVLAKRNGELAAENAELKKASTATGATTTATKRPGVAPIESAGANRRPGASSAGGDAVQEYNEAVAEQMTKAGYKDDRKKAISAVNRSRPDLHQAYLVATNPGRRQQELIADRFAD